MNTRSDGTPDFGTPAAAETGLAVPSGMQP
jgi:hypothetical protein